MHTAVSAGQLPFRPAMPHCTAPSSTYPAASVVHYPAASVVVASVSTVPCHVTCACMNWVLTTTSSDHHLREPQASPWPSWAELTSCAQGTGGCTRTWSSIQGTCGHACQRHLQVRPRRATGLQSSDTLWCRLSLLLTHGSDWNSGPHIVLPAPGVSCLLELQPTRSC